MERAYTPQPPRKRKRAEVVTSDEEPELSDLQPEEPEQDAAIAEVPEGDVTTEYFDQCFNHVKSKDFNFFKCTLCKKTFIEEEQIQAKRHSEWHRNRKSGPRKKRAQPVRRCDEHNIDFDSLAAQQKHYRDVHQTLQYACSVCDKKFKMVKYLKAHMNVHSQPFQCNVCQKQFSSNAKLSNHSDKYHPVVASSGSAQFYDQRLLLIHAAKETGDFNQVMPKMST
jgi:hypothetical protein